MSIAVLRSPVLPWVVAGAAIVFANGLWIDFSVFLFFFLSIVWLAVGGVLIAVPLTVALRPTRRRASLRTAGQRVAIVAISLALAWPVSRVGLWTTTWGRFLLNRHRYGDVVGQVTLASATNRGHLPPDVRVDEGPPLRVAFVWGGTIDNWCGVIFDPSRQVLAANAFNGDWATWSQQVPVGIKKLFGGDLVSCKALSPPYFHCCFT